MELSETKKILVEDVGLLLQERVNLSPLASRIYALLILSCYDGLSFDNIVQVMQASKSSVSSNINLLLKLHYINFYTKPGDRKRYFKTSHFYIKNTMEQQIHLIEKELTIVEKVNEFNKENNPDKFKDEKSMGLLFQEYLEAQKDKIITKLKEINEFQKQD